MKVYLIGPIDKGNVPTNGVTMKNQLFEMRFKELFDEVNSIDTWGISKKPWVIFQIINALIFNKKAKFVLSGGLAVRHVVNFLYFFKMKRDVFFWVAGGNINNAIKAGLYNENALKRLNAIIVQGKCMATELNEMGYANAVYVPNSKPVVFKPTLQNRNPEKPFKFVFLSRVHPDKGCDDIISSVKALNLEGGQNRFEVDFYGPLFDSYKKSFLSQIENIANISYRGFLNLTETKGYEMLSEYDAMLFPTFWKGEGFPGIILDAYIAGLPVIASDWNLNREVIEDHKSGIFIPVHDTKALIDAMRAFIDGAEDNKAMREYCLKQAEAFSTRKVISEELMKKLGFYD